ncbi:hypothetical protein [Thalassobacter stenotrophicus]|uniref:hypothetical protein n=1 Tax=Thalassobacter stenotrophicus TaxID=266809 RepID=UPI000D5D1419|nr:hypothetical protein [Thalassobacter stenotrophicus]PVZ47998.1 hypothetical protein DD557_04130 [Thalassobacter stenotrophicus]
MVDHDIPKEWLTTMLVSGETKMFTQSARADKIDEIASAFVNLRSEWDQVFGKIGPNDEIWEFDSPGDHWASLCGRAGVALVRAGEPIIGIVTEMN